MGTRAEITRVHEKQPFLSFKDLLSRRVLDEGADGFHGSFDQDFSLFRSGIIQYAPGRAFTVIGKGRVCGERA